MMNAKDAYVFENFNFSFGVKPLRPMNNSIRLFRLPTLTLHPRAMVILIFELEAM